MSGFDGLPKRWQVLLATSDAALASDTVSAPKRQVGVYGDAPANGRLALPDHFLRLKKDHAGRPLATLQHAALVVLIRRKLHLSPALDRFFHLWQHHEALLLNSLSLRWLVSAADTFADHGRSPAERAYGLSASLFVNTIKFYETERAISMQLDPTAADLAIQTPQFDLDGIVPYGVVSGDTAANLMRRVTFGTQGQGPAGNLLAEVVARANRLETVYARFRKLHKPGRNAW